MTKQTAGLCLIDKVSNKALLYMILQGQSEYYSLNNSHRISLKLHIETPENRFVQIVIQRHVRFPVNQIRNSTLFFFFYVNR